MSAIRGQQERYRVAKIMALACALLAGGAGWVMAQFEYPVWPATYRLYYANSYSNAIGTAVVSFSPSNDAMRVVDEATLYAATHPSGLTLCGDDLYWIERGSLYRGKKTGIGAKTLVKAGLGDYASDLIIRGGAIYVSGVTNGGQYGILKIDLNGASLQYFISPEESVGCIEKAGLHFLCGIQANIYAFSFSAGATNLLAYSFDGTSNLSDLLVLDTNIVWGEHRVDGTVRIQKRPMDGGGAPTLLYASTGDEAGYMDGMDNRIFCGITYNGNSFLGTVGVRGSVGGRGGPQNEFLLYGDGLKGIAIERLNQVKNDFDGDGIADRSVYYPATGEWYIFGSATGFYTDQFGYPGTIPVPGDYDGDGTTDYGVFDPAAGLWQIFRSSLGYFSQASFGNANMMPCISDYDNDGKSDLCLYNPPEGRWHIVGSKRGYFTDQFGNTFMIPVDTQTRAQY